MSEESPKSALGMRQYVANELRRWNDELSMERHVYSTGFSWYMKALDRMSHQAVRVVRTFDTDASPDAADLETSLRALVRHVRGYPEFGWGENRDDACHERALWQIFRRVEAAGRAFIVAEMCDADVLKRDLSLSEKMEEEHKRLEAMTPEEREEYETEQTRRFRVLIAKQKG